VSEIRVIDIGCGIGAQCQYLAQMGFSVKGFDISRVAIGRAKKDSTV
jgi:2-polyprenyl-3-methyl-5-hydroxy-6-metoxy-1,4-benzoquinol methylase